LETFLNYRSLSQHCNITKGLGNFNFKEKKFMKFYTLKKKLQPYNEQYFSSKLSICFKVMKFKLNDTYIVHYVMTMLMNMMF